MDDKVEDWWNTDFDQIISVHLNNEVKILKEVFFIN